MATRKTTKTKPNPSPAQLRARRKFAAMAKARAKAARAAKRLSGKPISKKKPIKRNNWTASGYTTAGAVKVSGKTYPKGTTFPKQRYVGQQGARLVVFTTKAEADMWGKAQANHVGRLVKVKKETLNKNGVTYRGAGTITYKPTKANPKRRNAEQRDAAHPTEVRKYYRSGGAGYLTQWQRAHQAGQKQLFSMNPSATGKKLYKEFTGRPARKVETMYAPKGSGAKGTLGAMGKLIKIKVKGRKPMNFQGVPILARDKKKMYVLGKGYTLRHLKRNPAGHEDLGEITEIQYQVRKDHLNDKGEVIYWHPMGEEGGKRPHAVINEEGLLLIQGGDYWIDKDGIHD